MKKMTCIALIALILLPFAACRYNPDTTEIDEFSDALHRAFSRDEQELLLRIYPYDFQTMTGSERRELKKIKDFFNDNPKLIKTETESIFGGYDVFFFYEKNDAIYRLFAECKQGAGAVYTVRTLEMSNVSEKCDDYNNAPFVPGFGLKITQLKYQKSYNNRVLYDGEAVVDNSTKQDIEYLRFRVSLISPKSTDSQSYGRNEVFRQTVETHQKIFEGDKISIPIPGLKELRLTENVDNLSLSIEIQEVRPKPESKWCQMLDEL